MQAIPLTPELRQQIEAVYHQALQIDPTKRPSFLDEVCGGNSSLRHEVESLLSAHDLKTAVSDSSSQVATEIQGGNPAKLIGQSIAQYKILSLLGRGGMGEVYLAHDSKLGRNVALKLLPKSLSHDEERLKRFAREARSASALNHPNVCIIHEIGETRDGCPFIAMEHIDGMNLRQRMKQGSIPLKDAVEIAQQMAAALIAAHKAGVVHRDVKPENIMLRPDGYVKVLDFGLAKLTEKYAFPSDSEVPTFPAFDTESEHLIGTVYYLSPEQAKRKAVDERTDIWSLGVVLYEMLAGRMPFSGRTPSHAIVAILESQPDPLTASIDQVPERLERIIQKALNKDRTKRYQTAEELAGELDTVKQELKSGVFETAKPVRRQSNFRIATAALVLLLVIVGGAVFYLLVHKPKPPDSALPSFNSVAVLPFVNGTNDPNLDYLSDGVTDNLINGLSQLPKLTVIGRSSAFRYRGVQKDAQTIATELGVQAILTGRVVEYDGNISIYVDLEDVRDKHHIWGDQYNAKMSDMITLQADLSRIITEKLRVKLNPEEQQRLVKQPTANADAYQLYLKGRWFWNKFTAEGMQQAAEYYQQAIDLDPDYALAYSGLADVYVVNNTNPHDSYLRAKAATEKALEVDHNLGAAHATLGYIKSHYEMDWPGAKAEFEQAIALSPNYATGHYWYGDHLLILGKYDLARQELRRAAELEPLSPAINLELGSTELYARDYDRAIEHFRNMVAAFPDFFPAHLELGWAYTQKKMYAEALAEYRQALPLSKGNNIVEATTAYTYAVSGKRPEALNILKELQTQNKHRVTPIRYAIIYAGLGDKQKAVEWLNRAYDDKDILLVYAGVYPFFDSLRDDPAFVELVKKMKLASA